VGGVRAPDDGRRNGRGPGADGTGAPASGLPDPERRPYPFRCIRNGPRPSGPLPRTLRPHPLAMAPTPDPADRPDGSTPDTGGRPGRAVLLLCALFLITPLVGRIVGVAFSGIPLFTEAAAPSMADVLATFGVGLLQDLAVAGLAAALVALAGGWRLAAGRWLLGLSFLAVHLYYLVDALLHAARGLRMNLAFAELFLYADSFVDSAKAVGRRPVLLGGVAALAVGVYLARRSGPVVQALVRRRFERAR